jgi:hypothetical protein
LRRGEIAFGPEVSTSHDVIKIAASKKQADPNSIKHRPITHVPKKRTFSNLSDDSCTGSIKSLKFNDSGSNTADDSDDSELILFMNEPEEVQQIKKLSSRPKFSFLDEISCDGLKFAQFEPIPILRGISSENNAYNEVNYTAVAHPETSKVHKPSLSWEKITTFSFLADL